MIRIYFDSNIFRGLKKQKQFNQEWYDAANKLKGKMIYCFSDAHLDDLRDSSEEHRNIDLFLMEEYVQDNYFSYNPLNKKFESLLATPIDAFNNKDYEAYNKAMFDPFNLENLFNETDDSPEMRLFRNVWELYLNMPISIYGNTIDETSITGENKMLLDKMIPNYHSEMSLKDFMKGASSYSAALLNDDKEVSELRKSIANYIDRDNYSFEKWGLEFNVKFKETGIGKTYLEMVDSMLTDNQKNDYQLKFSYLYSLLELYNITQERTKSGLKKFTLSSLTTDASHAYFGSFCDYLVSNDKGMQVKANIVYQLLGIQTKVLSPSDFVNLSAQLLRQEETYDSFLKSFHHDLSHAFLLVNGTSVETGLTTFKYKTGHNYFNYFNRLQVITEGKNPIYAFYCDRESHANFFMYREIEIVVAKLNSVLGLDYDLKGNYKFEENTKWEVGDDLRVWQDDRYVFSLVTSSKSFGNFIVLMIEKRNNN